MFRNRRPGDMWRHGGAAAVLLLGSLHCAAAEVVSATVGLGFAAAAAGLMGAYNYAKCNHFYECCDDRSLVNDVFSLRLDLERHLYGQHLVTETVVHALRSHLNNDKPAKALVLSFHGCTGCGKNYVADFITKHLYRLGRKSAFVKKFIGPKHFPYTENLEQQILRLQVEILLTVRQCERSMFIFDEVDKTPREVLEMIRAYLDFHHEIDGVDFRKTIFIFLGNTGESAINAVALRHREAGRARDDLTLQMVEKSVQDAAFNEPGGLQDNLLIDKYLISHFVPFLPLEREHVSGCIADRLRAARQPVTTQLVDRIADALEFHQVYSVSGCKRVAQKTDIVLEQERDAKMKAARSQTEL